jgi:hypothetical protein
MKISEVQKLYLEFVYKNKEMNLLEIFLINYDRFLNTTL